MSSGLVDSHCHLDLMDLAPFQGEVSGVVADARSAGVTHMLCVGVTVEHAPRVRALADRFPEVSASAGLHPNEHVPFEPSEVELAALADHPGVVAVGETGLDYYHGKGDLGWQQERFRRHVRAAREVGLPLIIHSRDAPDDTLRILQDEGAAAVGGVMHCFSETWEVAQRAMDLGFYISLSGIVTFKAAHQVHDVARRMPLDRLLVETDSPWLAPTPFRGKPNRPAYVHHVAQAVAALRETHLDEVAAATTANFFALFRRASPAA